MDNFHKKRPNFNTNHKTVRGTCWQNFGKKAQSVRRLACLQESNEIDRKSYKVFGLRPKTITNNSPWIFINTEETSIKVKLNVIPYWINIVEKKFVLVGVIGYEGTGKKLYIAYTRSMHGQWNEINGTVRIKGKNVKPSLEVYIANLMYVIVK